MDNTTNTPDNVLINIQHYETTALGVRYLENTQVYNVSLQAALESAIAEGKDVFSISFVR